MESEDDTGGNADGVALVVASSAGRDASKEQLKQDVDGGTADVDDTGLHAYARSLCCLRIWAALLTRKQSSDRLQ
jgi:hypothetical protein